MLTQLSPFFFAWVVILQTLGANTRPEARQLLRRYKVANLALLAGALYLIAVIFISIQEPSSQALCFLVSFDVLLLPFLFG